MEPSITNIAIAIIGVPLVGLVVIGICGMGLRLLSAIAQNSKTLGENLK